MKSKLPKAVNILVLTTITVLMWISLNIYRSFSLKPKPVVPDEVSNPLNPSLDSEQIENIKQKLYLGQ